MEDIPQSNVIPKKERYLYINKISVLHIYKYLSVLDPEQILNKKAKKTKISNRSKA